MTSEPTSDPVEEDRVVSRRVDNPTSAGPDDERVYHAGSDDDPDPAGEGEGSEPTRTE
jgi:hypothetical protein